MTRIQVQPGLQSDQAVPASRTEGGFSVSGVQTLAGFDDDWGQRPLVGLDEAGRGPLAGPLVAAAVILDPFLDYPGLNDSKKLAAEAREIAFELIMAKALACSYAVKPPGDVDRLNPLGASLLAMSEAEAALSIRPVLALVDGNKRPHLSCRTVTVVHGDAQSNCIAAASIVAKVIRDRLMMAEHEKYPQYGFDRHKGYGTKEHMAALEKWGPSPIHRLTYRGVVSEPGKATLF